MSQPGFFDLDERYEALSKQGDPLQVLNSSISWSTFRRVLKKIQKSERKSNTGRKPYDAILMFKILVLQSLYNLSDEQAEYQIRDRFVVHAMLLRDALTGDPKPTRQRDIELLS